MATSKKGPDAHVVPNPGGKGFVVKVAGNPTPVTRPATQERSIEKARPIARANHSEIVIHGRNGRIRDKDSEGHDPNPPRDTK